MICCTVVSRLFPEHLIGIFSNDPTVIRFGVIYLAIFSLGYVAVGTIIVAALAFQGLGKTYPCLIGAALDNVLFAGLVLTLPVFFSWGIQSVWWIKLVTAIAEMIGMIDANELSASAAKDVLDGILRVLEERAVSRLGDNRLRPVDVRVLAATNADLQPLAVGDSDDLRLGDQLVAMGYALGLDGEPSVTSGILSARNRTITEPNGEQLVSRDWLALQRFELGLLLRKGGEDDHQLHHRKDDQLHHGIGHRSISPSTMSSVPMTATRSATR